MDGREGSFESWRMREEEGVEGGETFGLEVGEVAEEEAVFVGEGEGGREGTGVFGEEGKGGFPVGLRTIPRRRNGSVQSFPPRL